MLRRSVALAGDDNNNNDDGGGDDDDDDHDGAGGDHDDDNLLSAGPFMRAANCDVIVGPHQQQRTCLLYTSPSPRDRG